MRWQLVAQQCVVLDHKHGRVRFVFETYEETSMIYRHFNLQLQELFF